jgi:hypothetical protein
MLVVAANRNVVTRTEQSPYKVQGLYFRAPYEEDGRKDQDGSSLRMNLIDYSDRGEAVYRAVNSSCHMTPTGWDQCSSPLGIPSSDRGFG